jgi:hypothetical protein
VIYCSISRPDPVDICPVCRASLNGTNTCRRCRADLSKVQEIERRGQSLVGAAMLSVAMRTLLPNGSIVPAPFTPCRQFRYCAHCWPAGLSGREIRNGLCHADRQCQLCLVPHDPQQARGAALNSLELLRANYTERGQRCGPALHARECARSPGRSSHARQRV